MNADIIQFIPRPRNEHEQTDFPTIAFRSIVHHLAKDQADDHVNTAPCEHVEPEGSET